jgi:hypothetical protein
VKGKGGHRTRTAAKDSDWDAITSHELSAVTLKIVNTLTGHELFVPEAGRQEGRKAGRQEGRKAGSLPFGNLVMFMVSFYVSCLIF